MKTQRLAIGLTVINLMLLMFLLAQIRPAVADGVAPVLRGRMLEIVDDHGRVRASIKVQPAGTANGVTYPENVILRLIDPNGRPEVKLGSSVEGAGLGLIGQTDSTHVVLEAQGARTLLKLINKDGRERRIEP